MRLSDLSSQIKKVIVVVVIAGGLYLYLTFGALSISVRALFFDFIKAILSFLFPQYDISPTVRAIVFDVVFLTGIAGAFWIFFFSQFVLPVRTFTERYEAFLRLVNSIMSPGPAIFVSDGEQKKEGLEKRDRKGPGVILLDTASAAVLHHRGEFNPVGPGLVFTRANETIQSTVDLHIQSRTLGPEPDENPFAKQGETESNDDYGYRQTRRKQTSGLTRDGIEIIPNISVTFRLRSENPKGEPQFVYDLESIRLAVTREGINPKAPNDAGSYKINWDWLPVHVAADIWREYLRKFTMNELFEITNHEIHEISQTGSNKPKTVFRFINYMIKERLTEERVPNLGDQGQVIGTTPSSEYQLLYDHGIQVLNVNVSNPLIAEENKLIERWRATWLQRAKAEQKEIEKRHQEKLESGQKNTLQDFSFTISSQLEKELLAVENGKQKEAPNLVHSLELLARGTLSYLSKNQPQGPAIDDPKSDVIEIIDWLRSRRNGNNG
jgi:hypothetical protein